MSSKSDGVVLLENVLSQSFIDRFSAEYAKFDASCVGKRKPKTRWWFSSTSKVSKREPYLLKECSILESFILNDLVRILTLNFPK